MKSNNGGTLDTQLIRRRRPLKSRKAAAVRCGAWFDGRPRYAGTSPPAGP
jgi:hypothetical protein